MDSYFHERPAATFTPHPQVENRRPTFSQMEEKRCGRCGRTRWSGDYGCPTCFMADFPRVG